MRKRCLGVFLAICLILPCSFIMSACDDKITDCAYVQFVPAIDGEVVQYSARMYAGSEDHIYLFESEEKKNNTEGFGKDYLLRISFKRNLGIDYNIDEKETLMVDIEKISSMEIRIKKEYYYRSQDTTVPKRIYLNGVDITSKAIPNLSAAPKENPTALGDFWDEGYYYFENFGLVKGNSSEFINTIEFK